MTAVDPTVTAKYKCHRCLRGSVPLEVRARVYGEDVIAYTYRVAKAAGEDHARRSPHCSAAVADLMVPVPHPELGVGLLPLPGKTVAESLAVLTATPELPRPADVEEWAANARRKNGV